MKASLLEKVDFTAANLSLTASIVEGWAEVVYLFVCVKEPWTVECVEYTHVSWKLKTVSKPDRGEIDGMTDGLQTNG
jgi:hypothetical protein